MHNQKLQKENYKQVYASESWPGIGIEIRVTLDREETEAERRVFRKAAESIEDIVERTNLSLDTKVIAFRQETREKFIALFRGRDILVKELPNGYCSRACCSQAPWFEVTTSKGVITLGWRKRVINITYPDFPALQVSDDTTQGDNYIHAWGYDKAQEYIDKLLSVSV